MHIDRTESKKDCTFRLHLQSYERIKHSRKNLPIDNILFMWRKKIIVDIKEERRRETKTMLWRRGIWDRWLYTYPKSLWSKDQVGCKVSGFDHATCCIDGDHQHLQLHIRHTIYHPQHTIEECAHIRNAWILLHIFLLHYVPKCPAVKQNKNHHNWNKNKITPPINNNVRQQKISWSKDNLEHYAAKWWDHMCCSCRLEESGSWKIPHLQQFLLRKVY